MIAPAIEARSELPDSHLTVESGLQISTGIASDRTEILPG